MSKMYWCTYCDGQIIIGVAEYETDERLIMRDAWGNLCHIECWEKAKSHEVEDRI